MSKEALLTGTAGGMIGAITAATGIIWIFIAYTYLTEINSYISQLTLYLTSRFAPWQYGYGFPIPCPIPYYPSAPLSGLLALILSIFLIVTGILIGIGFYGMYKISGEAVGIVGFISSNIGFTLGALLIIIGNLTTGYMYAGVYMEMATVPFLPVPTTNFPVIGIGFMVIGLTFIILGSASIKIGGMTMNPSIPNAAGILSIIGALLSIIGASFFIISIYSIFWITVLITGLGLIFVAFILWAIVFYSSRYM